MNHRIAAVTGRVVPRHPRQRDGSRLSPARHDSDGGGDRRGSGRAIRGAGADGGGASRRGERSPPPPAPPRPPLGRDRLGGGVAVPFETGGRLAPPCPDSSMSPRLDGEDEDSGFGEGRARCSVARADPAAGRRGGGSDDDGGDEGGGGPANPSPVQRRSVTFAAATDFARGRRPALRESLPHERPRDDVRHDYTRVGGPIAPKARLDANVINDMLAEMARLWHAGDHGRAEDIDHRLHLAGVRLNKIQREWRADGGAWAGVSAACRRVLQHRLRADCA